MKTRMKWFVTVAVLFAGANQAKASIIAETGFNDETGIHGDAVVDDTPYGSGNNIAGAGTGEPGWTTLWENADGSSAAPLVASSTTVLEGDLAAFVDGNGATSGSGGRQANFRRGFPTVTSIVTYEFSAYFDVWGGNNQGSAYYIEGNDDTTFRNDAVTFEVIRVGTTADGKISLRNGADSEDVTNAGPLSLDTWYDFKIVANIATDKFEAYLDGVQLETASGSSWDFRHAVNDLTSIRINQRHDSYMDAVRIGIVPEPSSLLLACLGLVGLWGRTRNRSSL